ncbi:MAG: hypothetical protein M5T61_20945 [Acidimicrobiia bacterium]|nr:hypothetical protein [Acidimicrobiia bacterium]
MPDPLTHDKLEEAHYFLHSLLFTIHHPDEFRWNLNAFLQTCRSILYLAHSEPGKRDGFKVRYESADAELEKVPVIKCDRLSKLRRTRADAQPVE